jgi:hypothetical protein
MKWFCLNILLWIVFCGFTWNGQAKGHIENRMSLQDTITKTHKAIYNLDSLDYVVISEGIYQFLTLPKTLSHSLYKYRHRSEHKRIGHFKSFVLIDSTFLFDPIDDYIINKHCKKDCSDSIWIRSLNVNIDFQSKLDIAPLKHLRYSLLPLTKMKEIFINGDEARINGWSDFYKTYGDPSLIIKTSIPSFNEVKDRAMLYVDAGSGPLQGRGGIIWLKIINGKWTAYDLVELWVA